MKKQGHVPIPLICTTCKHGYMAPPCASSEHKRIATEIELGLRRPDGTVKRRQHTYNRRTPAEIATLKATRARTKAEFRGQVRTILDPP